MTGGGRAHTVGGGEEPAARTGSRPPRQDRRHAHRAPVAGLLGRAPTTAMAYEREPTHQSVGSVTHRGWPAKALWRVLLQDIHYFQKVKPLFRVSPILFQQSSDQYSM